MSATDLLAAIRASRHRNITTCDLAILCALAAGPITGREELSRLTSFEPVTCAMSAGALKSGALIHIHSPGRPKPNTHTITTVGLNILTTILSSK